MRRGAHKVTQKMPREIEQVLTVDDIKKLESSEYMRECLGIIEEAQRGHPCNQSMFVDVRDYLTTTLTLQNGSRTGVVENIKMEDYEKGKKDRDGNFVCTVDRKKTDPQYGPARLVFKPRVHLYTDIYVSSIRSNFAGPMGPLFPNVSGFQPRKKNLTCIQGSRGEV